MGVRVPPEAPITRGNMPSLLLVNDFKGKDRKYNPNFYFKNTWTQYASNEIKFDVAKEYPYIFTIHRDVMEQYDQNDNVFFVDLRRWVERSCAGDVFLEYKNMNYRWWWNRDAKSEYQRETTEVRHGYWYLYFECECDFTMFGLKHGEKYSTVEQYHPSYGKDILEQDKIYDKVT